MPVALEAIAQSKDNKLNHVFVQATMSGNYTSDGDDADFTDISDPLGILVLPDPGVEPIISKAQESLTGYYAQIVVPADPTDLSAYKVSFWASEASQLAAAGYPAAISGGKLVFELIF